LLSRTFETAANLFAQPDRLTLSIRLRLRPHARGPFIEIDVENLTDRISVLVPRDPLHPDGADRTRLPVQDFRGNPLPGRAIYVTMGGELR
jgi:hypothetical protein